MCAKKVTKNEILKETVDEITNRRTFEPWTKPTIGCRFVRMKEPGETICGRLGFAIQNFHQPSSYPIILDDDEIVELVGNRLLHKQIREGELSGQRIEIVYQGCEFTGFGHRRKIYRIYKIGHEEFPKKVWDKILAKTKSGKKQESKEAKNG